MADVSTPNSEYSAAQPLWELVRDACAGEAAIKAAGEKYLPRPNPSDTSSENVARYDAYVRRALYYNASGRTLEGFLGLAFQKDPKIEAPTALADVLANIDGAGQSIVQQMHETLGQVIETGRAGLLTDFPATVATTSRADQVTGGMRPTITFYGALQVINWRTVVIGNQAKLSLVVLSEAHRVYDEFGEKGEQQFRVLRLEAGVYSVEIWRQRSGTAGLEWFIAEGPFFPKGGNGQAIEEIPFTFVGSKNNGVSINRSPMLDIAAVNVAHYRNSADYEDSAFFCGQPTFYITNLDVEWRTFLEKKGVYVGARSVMPLPANSELGMVQAQPNTLAKEAMDGKEKQMAALGARILQSDNSIKTATQQDSEDGVANSVLGLCCDNVSAAYTRSLGWVGMFANTPGKAGVSIPKDFTQFTISPEELGRLMEGVQKGLIPQSDLWRRLRSANVIDPKKTDDNIREEIEANPPPGLATDDPEPGTDPE